MKTYQIIRFLARSEKTKKIWLPLRRYFILVDNYLQGKPISIVEKKNHQYNPPREVFLKKVFNGFDLEYDLTNPLWESRINTTYGEPMYYGDNWSLFRFFRRLDEAKRANFVITEESLIDFVMMGEVVFKHKYPNFIPLDP